MAFKEAREEFGKALRWEEKGDDEKSLFLGNVIEGFYIEKKDNVGPNESTIHTIKLKDDGTLVSMWGSDLIDGKFAKVPFGSMVRVEHLGMAKPKTPQGRAYRNFKILFDENTRDMKEATNVQPGNQEAQNEQANADAADEGY